MWPQRRLKLGHPPLTHTRTRTPPDAILNSDASQNTCKVSFLLVIKKKTTIIHNSSAMGLVERNSKEIPNPAPDVKTTGPGWNGAFGFVKNF